MHVDRSATQRPDLSVVLSAPSPPAGGRVRATGSSLGLHPWGLALILFAIMPIVGTDSVWSADVGAQLYQAVALTEGMGWTIPHPFPEADPSGHFFPIHLSSFAESGGAPLDGRPQTLSPDGAGYVVFGKHVAFTWIVAGLLRIGGFGAVIAFATASTLAASIAAARLTSLVHQPAAVPALWITGLASPLFFDGYVGYAHTFAAALIAWGAFFLCRFLLPPISERHAPADLVLAALPLLIAPMVRTEAPLAGLALGFGLISVALALRVGTFRPPRGPTPRDGAGDADQPMAYGLAGTVALVATMAGLSLDRRLAVPVGGLAERYDPVAGWGFVDGRIEALVRTWFLPGGDGGTSLLVIATFALMVAAAAVARRASADGDSTNTTVVRLILVAAASTMLARLVLAPPATIPGLLLAFPLLVAGLVLIRSEDLRNPKFATLTIAFALFCGAVLATQYPLGGTAEWGGRYFAVGLPLGVAIATPGLVRFAHSLGRRQRTQLAALVAVVVVLTSTMGILTLRNSRQRTGWLVEDIEATLGPAGDADGSPVVVTTAQPVGRWAWSTVNQGRWLRIEHRDLAGVGERLTNLDIDRLTFVSWNAESDLDVLSPWYEVDDGAAEISDWGENRIFVLQAVTPGSEAPGSEAPGELGHEGD